MWPRIWIAIIFSLDLFCTTMVNWMVLDFCSIQAQLQNDTKKSTTSNWRYSMSGKFFYTNLSWFAKTEILDTNSTFPDVFEFEFILQKFKFASYFHDRKSAFESLLIVNSVQKFNTHIINTLYISMNLSLWSFLQYLLQYKGDLDFDLYLYH